MQVYLATMTLQEIRSQIIDHPTNRWARNKGWEPVYSAHKESRVVVIGQAPGKKTQESHVPWNDVSGEKLRAWLGVTEEQFYDPKLFALIPMDFYYPGKAAHGDKPPRKDFASQWHPLILSHMSPKLIILIGSYAQEHYLAKTAKKNLTENVRNYHKYLPKYFPLVHPSPLNFRWNSKNRWFEEEVLPVLKQKTSAIIH